MAWPDIAAEMIGYLNVSPLLTPEDAVEHQLYTQALARTSTINDSEKELDES